MINEEIKYRMYGLVPYNLSPIQQGIQFGHAVVEYMLKYPPELNEETKQWANYDKTFIVLNGGTTNLGYQGDNKGTINKYLDELLLKKIKLARFYEPDLGNQLTSVVFLVPEQVWDYEKYPDFYPTNGLIINDFQQPNYNEWVDSLGGEKNVWLRSFLKQFRLA